MDEDVSGRGASPSGVPDAATIRRALGECMTLADIDDVMGWSAGTARRRRWRDPAKGGLPPADAELGGVALWFRTTVSRWRAGAAAGAQDAERAVGDDRTPPGRASGPARDAGSRPQRRSQPPPEPEPRSEAPPEPAARPEAEREPGAEAEARSEPDDRPEPQSEPEAGIESTEAPAPATSLHSGFQLDEEQDVLAYVHGSWQPAVVRSRAHRTVVVDYQVHPGSLGARRQRVSIDRIRQNR